MIPSIISLVIAVMGATWYLAQQLARLNATLEGMREDLHDALKMAHDHEVRLALVEDKVSQ